jgi:hypothetical protein
MNYSRRQLEALGEPFGESATRLTPGGGGKRIYGGGGGPTNSTVTQTNIPDWLRPQVETVLGGGMKELFNTKEIPGVDGEPSTFEITGAKPFQAYSNNPADYVAGFSPLQQQAQYNAANLQVPGQFQQGTQLANAAGQGALQSAQQAYGYGNAGFQSGQMGQQLGTQGGQYYGGMGAGYGQQGAQLGMQGGQYYGGMGAGYGAQAAGMAPQAQQYGQTAADIGQMGLRAETLGQSVTQQARDYAAQQAAAGQQYASQMTDPYAVQQYMNPYQSAVTDVQVQAAQRQADIAANARKSQAARAGAYGGSRQAIENAEANRALATQMDTIRAQGQQSAYDRAVQAMQYGSNLGLQGLGGAQQGLGTALQGGQLGLSGIGQAMAGQQAGLAGLGQAGQLYGLGMQGAGVGLQGTQQQLAGTAQGMQGAQIGLQGVDRQLAGTAQGMQGAQVGLQGVSGAQAGYGLANQSANTLGSLGTQQLNAQTGILGLQNQIGGQQQAQEQAITNQAIQTYGAQQENAMNKLNQYNALLRGYALPGTTATTYAAAPSAVSQIAGLGTAGIAGLGLANAMK